MRLGSAAKLGKAARLAAGTIWAVLSPLALAQTTGNIEGRITEPGGSPLPGARVEASSSALQGTRVTVAAGEGSFRIPGLPPGRYLVTGRLEGFLATEAEALVPLDGSARVDLALKLAKSEEVTVSGEAPPIDSTSTTTGTNYRSDLTERLPVGRNYADIIRANPGVTTDRGETQGRSLALSIYGATSVENQWFIDGIDTTNVIKGFQGKAINSEFVEEVQVKTGGYQAEYGRALGGIVNVITKSGGNKVHGDVFTYHDRSDWLAAETVTDSDPARTGMRIADYKKTDFGADVGGPILKDRLWLFLAADRVQAGAHVSRYQDSELVPASQQFPLDAVDSLYSGKLTLRVGAGTTLVATAFSDPTTNSGAGRADPRQGAFVAEEISNPDPATWQSDRKIGGTDFGLRAEQLFGGTAFATLQAARHQDRYELIPTYPGDSFRLEDFTCEGGTLLQPCRPPPFPNFVTAGVGARPVFGWTNRNESGRDQLRGDVSLFLGLHDVKLGGDIQEETTKTVTFFWGGQIARRYNERGVVYYQHQFYVKSPTDLTPVDSVNEGRTSNGSLFLQDSWKVLPGLTVNAGLRWDREDVGDYSGKTVIRTDLFQPRLGAVWDPRRDGRTKLYASAGRFSYALPTDISARAFNASVSAVTYNFDSADRTHDPGVPGHSVPRFFGGSNDELVDPGLGGAYQDELTLGIERLLSPGFTIGLKGTYRRLGRTIEDRCDLNYNVEETSYNSCGIMNPGSDGPVASGALPACNVLDTDSCDENTPTTLRSPASPKASRIYRGIEVLARKSFGGSGWVQASYVYSSLRGNYDGGVRGLDGQTDPGINFDFDYPQLWVNDYGRLSLDRPHSFRLDGTWTAPFGLFVGAQFFVQSGAPTNRMGYLNQYSFGGEGVFLVPRGTEGRLPTQWEANLTLGYPLRAGPLTATLQLYVFNLFNNQIPLARDDGWSIYPPPDYPSSLHDPNQEQNNPNYGKYTARQSPRLVRAAVRVSF
jgi:hypothetical protein